MKNRKIYIFLALGSIILFIIGLYAANYIQKNYESDFYNKIVNNARLAALSLDGDKLKNLSITPDDNASIDYIRLRNQILSLHQVLKIEGATGIYTVQLKNGSVLFSVDSWAIRHQLHSEPGDLYELPPKELFNAFQDGEPILAGPYNDEFGYWFSVFVPIKDVLDGNIIQVLGIDIDGSYYDAKILSHKTYTHLIALLAYGFILLGCLYIVNIRINIRKLGESAKLLGDLMAGTALCVKGFDAQGKLFFINKHGKEEHYLTNLSDEEIKNWDFMSSIKEGYRSVIKTAFESALAGKESTGIVIEHIPGTATGAWCSGDFLPVKNLDGSIKYVYFMSKNIDDIKLAEIELANRKNELEKINKLMINRELKMIELKKEIEELKVKLNNQKLS